MHASAAQHVELDRSSHDERTPKRTLLVHPVEAESAKPGGTVPYDATTEGVLSLACTRPMSANFGKCPPGTDTHNADRSMKPTCRADRHARDRSQRFPSTDRIVEREWPMRRPPVLVLLVHDVPRAGRLG
jgi:hypothetical protein